MDNLLNIDRLNKTQVEDIIYLASSLKKDFPHSTKDSPLKGKNVIFLFLESSTRTKTSFNFACSILGANVIDISPKSSSMTKGETFENTIKTISSYPADALVLRSNENNDINIAKNILDFPVINAGSGTKSHPTQALTDLMTLIEKGVSIEKLKISIVGDIEHSRVARSNMLLLGKMENRIRLVGPSTLIPSHIGEFGVEVYHDMLEGLKDVDVVMMLRLQKERMDGGFIPSEREYFQRYGLDFNKLSYAKDDAIVMHPGPMNRGVEIDGDIADDVTRSVIQEQVEMGVAVRMAIMDLLARNMKINHTKLLT